ncbi:hypothetical protein [Flavihumibacter sp. ZG627]|uniref:hypothetical protein n=1 Tax=Flavihumibacter sp. ZG627 TaxID=1463156 RepID=UPI0012E009B9|nr:hypothetical protein [Flavihumibacter sp. ZG627]
MGGFEEAAIHAIEEGMGCFVGDDIMREAGEHDASGQVDGAVGGGGVEVAEEQGFSVGRVISVLVAQGMREYQQLPHEFEAAFVIAVGHLHGAPHDFAAQGFLEIFNGVHGNGVHHLLVELRIGFTRCETVGCQYLGTVKVHGFVDGVAGGVAVNDAYIFSIGTRLEVILPGDFIGDLVDACCVEVEGGYGVEGIASQLAERRAVVEDMVRHNDRLKLDNRV